MAKKSKVIITKDMTMDERLEVIRKAAAKFNKKIKRNHVVKATETSFMDKYDDGDNINAWTDASKYAAEYYGEVAYETTRHDNNWD